MPMGNLVTGWLVDLGKGPAPIVPIFTAPFVLAANGIALVSLALYFLLVQRKVATL
jgi:hypothetical protein